MMMTGSAASARRGTPPRHAFIRSSYLLLLGFAVHHLCVAHGATSEEEVSTPHIRDNDGLLAVGLLTGFRGKHDVGALELLARMPANDTDNSSGMVAHHSREEVDLSRGDVDVKPKQEG